MGLSAALRATPFADYIHKRSLVSTICLVVAAVAIQSPTVPIMHNHQQVLQTCQRSPLLHDFLTLVSPQKCSQDNSLNAKFPLNAANVAFHCCENHCKDTSPNNK